MLFVIELCDLSDQIQTHIHLCSLVPLFTLSSNLRINHLIQRKLFNGSEEGYPVYNSNYFALSWRQCFWYISQKVSKFLTLGSVPSSHSQYLEFQLGSFLTCPGVKDWISHPPPLTGEPVAAILGLYRVGHDWRTSFSFHHWQVEAPSQRIIAFWRQSLYNVPRMQSLWTEPCKLPDHVSGKEKSAHRWKKYGDRGAESSQKASQGQRPQENQTHHTLNLDPASQTVRRQNWLFKPPVCGGILAWPSNAPEFISHLFLWIPQNWRTHHWN